MLFLAQGVLPVSAQADATFIPPVEIPLAFDRLTVADGLSEGTTIAMTQDTQGFMWFGTQYGLNKYDGYQFTVYTHNADNPDSLSDDNIRALYAADDGSLWVGTVSGGLNRLDRATDKFTHYRYSPDAPDGLNSNTIRALQADSKGGLWVGTNNGLSRMDLVSGRFTHYAYEADDVRSLASNQVYALALDNDGRLWVGTDEGVCRFDAINNDFFCYELDATGSPAGDIVNALYTDSEGILWVGTNRGLNALDTQSGAVIKTYVNNTADPYSISGSVVRAIYEDAEGRIWVGTQAEGLNLFDRTRERFTRYRHDPDVPTSVSGNNIISIFQDRSGILWVGTWAADMNFIAPTQHKFPLIYPIRTPTNVQMADGFLWAATLEDGLFRIDLTTHEIRQFTHEPTDAHSLISNNALALHRDRTGRLWIGTMNGLDRYNPETETFDRPFFDAASATGLNETTIRSILEDRQGRLWMGTHDGLYCLDLETGQFDCYQGESEMPFIIYTIAEGVDGMLWLGSDVGLYRLDPNSGQVDAYRSSALGGNINLQAILPNDDGSLWLGSWGAGMFYFEPDSGATTHYTQKDGLPGDLILDIEKDNWGRLWLSTSAGLTMFNPADGAVRTYNRYDGLPENDFNGGAAFRGDDGTLYFGSASHVVAFSPEELVHNTYVPPVIFTGFQLFNKQVAVGADGPLPQHANITDELTLSYDQSVFSFEYAALNFSAPERNQYAYKMEGFDSEWNYVGNRRMATYTNLDPGVYTFRVRASNNDGIWNEEGLSVRLTITPPWWRTWWAYLLYGAVGVAGVLGYVRYRTHAHARELAMQRLELAQERHLRETIERVDRSKDEERTRIAREMHDGMAQTLAGLRFQVRTWQRMIQDNPKRLHTEIGDMNGVLDETLQELRRVIFALTPANLSEMGLRASIERLVESMRLRSAVEIHCEVTGDDAGLPDELAHAAFRIIQETFHNVMRHAQARQVWLNVQMNPAMIEIEVCDDGIGFDTDVLSLRAQQGHHGIVNLRARAAAFNGSTTIRSAPGQGTTVHIRLFTE